MNMRFFNMNPITLLVEDHFAGVALTTLPPHLPVVDVVGGGWLQSKTNGGTQTPNHVKINTTSQGNAWFSDTDFYGSVIDCGTRNVDINVLYHTSSGDNERYGIPFRYAIDGNGYELEFRSDFSDIRLYKIVSGVYQPTLTFVSYNFAVNTDYQIRVIIYDQKIRVYLNTLLVLSYDSLVDFSTQTLHGLSRRSLGAFTFFQDLYIYSGVPIS